MRKNQKYYMAIALAATLALGGVQPVLAEKEKEPEIAELSAASADELEEMIDADVEESIQALTERFEKLQEEIDTYEKYKENIDKVEGFYTDIYKTEKELCIRLREYALKYEHVILDSGKGKDEIYDDLDELYDIIYEDASDDVYDEIYDGVLDEIYDVFYDGVLDDVQEEIDYKEWADARSDEYERWLDTRSDTYEDWLDFRSEVYEFWLDLRGEVLGGDFERAEKKMQDFQEDIDKLKEKQKKKDGESAETEEGETEKTENEEASEKTSETASAEKAESGGMRPEFKEAMDSYEVFYEEYCKFLADYSANPTDMTLIAKYADMVSQLAEMDKKFQAWNEDELSTEELKYYLDVNNRVMQKLVDVSGQIK